MTYDEETIRKIDDSVDLLEYVSQSIVMEKRGNNYFGTCPLHVDNTPSFSISEDNYFYCFSCGRSGRIISYLRQYENLSFQDAVEKAAKLANIDITQMCTSKTVSFLRGVRKSNQTKMVAPHRVLDKSELQKYYKDEIKEWKDEGIKQDVLDLFQVRINRRDNRIVYPVYDLSGNLINIKGRTRYANYKALRIPKYINYFSVGTMDYFQGLNITLPYVKEKNEVIIFESIKSVMKAYGWGYKNCVSAEKHSITDEQMQLLVKLRVNVVFAFDTDVNYFSADLQKTLDKLKRMTNVYVISDKNNLLGGKETKNAPVDLTLEIWEELYNNKLKIV